jgi:pyridoxal phosphate enzyme (YggS family)
VQGNKARDVAKLFDCVDSVDSIDLAKQLDKEAASAGKKLRILLEVNLSGELTKYGFDLAHWDGQTDKRDRFLATISDLTRFSNITIEGLMTMPRYVTNPEDNRAIFQSMKKLSETLRTQTPGFGSELSMGTSCDYRVAIEEGATQVRLGEVLFGKRPVVR